MTVQDYYEHLAMKGRMLRGLSLTGNDFPDHKKSFDFFDENSLSGGDQEGEGFNKSFGKGKSLRKK